MALKHILEDIGSILGLDLSDPDELVYLTDQVNHAAREIYNSMDLPGSIREQIFQVSDVDNYQVSFPQYIDKIRAIRFYNNLAGKIQLEDLRPRYHEHNWNGSNRLSYRIKASNSPLASDITNAGYLTFTLPTGKLETYDIEITIVGRTSSAERVQETVTLLAGTSSIASVESYEAVITIIKSEVNNFNITVTDIDGAELSVIPNSELSTAYTIVQIRADDYSSQYGNSYPLNTIEVLYKVKFSGFKNLYDEFPAPNCDKIIFWKFAEHYSAYKPGMEQRAAAAKIKVDQLLSELNRSDEMGKAITIERSEPNVYKAQKATQQGYYYGSL